MSQWKRHAKTPFPRPADDDIEAHIKTLNLMMTTLANKHPKNADDEVVNWLCIAGLAHCRWFLGEVAKPPMAEKPGRN